MSVAVDQLHRLRGLGRHDRALTSSLAPPGGSTEATKERLICSQIELATDGAILLRQDGRASWASFHGKSDGRRVFTVEFKRGELERLLGQEADGDRDSAGGAGGCKEKSAVAQRVRTVTQHPVAAICRTLRMARQTAYSPRASGRRASIGGSTTRPCSSRSAPHEQPRHLRLSSGVGHGEPDLSRRLQPQAHSEADADARPHSAEPESD